MKTIRDCACDAGLHILALAALMIYLAQTLPQGDLPALSKLVACSTCHIHHYPERTHTCEGPRDIAQARP